MGISRVGPYDGLLAFALNDIELDMLRVKEHAGDAKWVEQVKHATERAKNMQAMMASPEFRVFRTTMLPAETLATVQGLPSADRALAQVRQAGSPFLRMTISRAGTDKCSGLQCCLPGRAIEGRFGRTMPETAGCGGRGLRETGTTLVETDARS
ncbi:hypothetical protein E4V01_24370 [Methylorubrum sp. Q1]|uniref:hypothetical protein n=1 Tax=Methylorubrum sp. Q1 TaxID=2562453 RepID=UPI001075E5B7|nr:hypothetical protein [Methylorubrum sp. Q1]TFZ54894.1 hypothetical protein E4V01_24370 [Methylorubrum sp. Q1]